MHTELKYGRIAYLSFLSLDLACLVVANFIALYFYVGSKHVSYTFKDHYFVMIIMLAIDVGVTFVFSTLRRVLRWKNEREIYESARHVLYCLIVLMVFLFLTKSSYAYSRAIVLMTYGIDFILICFFRTAWRTVLQTVIKKEKESMKQTVLLMTTDSFLKEGVERLEDLGFEVKYLYLLKNRGRKEANGIPVIDDIKEAASAICWEMIDRIYIYGLDHQMVPEYLSRACREMNMDFELVDFNYRVIYIKTIQNKDPKYGALSFLEGKRDIPFPIRRVYWITETDADLHRGFHAHKLNCQLLYCPYGSIDIILDDGKERVTVTLDRPEKGLILMPGLWREMVWNQKGSVLCVLASEYYDEDEYIRDYDEFIAYSNKYRKATTGSPVSPREGLTSVWNHSPEMREPAAITATTNV